jgi:RinA family phage transcriptional activator
MAAVAEKLKRGTFKHIESELYYYWDTVKEIKRIRADIIGASPIPDDVGGGRSNLPGDPTGRTAEQLLLHRRLEQLERIAGAIREVIDELPDDKKRLVQLKYWTHPQTLTWEGIARKIPISKRQAIRWRDEIVQDVAARLGWR